MLTLAEVKDLIELIEKSTINKVDLKYEDGEVLLEKTNPTIVNAPIVPTLTTADPIISVATETSEAIEEITAPMVGTFYSSSEPNTPSFVTIGSKVHPNTIVCVLESMKIFSEIEAQTEGEIVEILAKDGDFVEYGQPLFKIKTI